MAVRQLRVNVTQSKPKFGVLSGVNRITNMKLNDISLYIKRTGSSLPPQRKHY